MDSNNFEQMMRSASAEVRQQYYDEAKQTLADSRKLATQAFTSGMFLEDARASNQAIIDVIEKIEREQAGQDNPSA